ncbi:hypothetical protein MAM1_0001d00057 [Mucor ambiguus]|uniref:Uncharacterized protein n=1 Tax=Mucor ambiguus TaxID=91626 RepID=A0A0C9LP82_9FUNG|nr:hypothetical protein MAM1_0001d00057 [Mucor ambiguus]
MISMDNQAIAFFTSKIKTFTVVYEPFPTLGGFLIYASLWWKPTYMETVLSDTAASVSPEHGFVCNDLWYSKRRCSTVLTKPYFTAAKIF